MSPLISLNLGRPERPPEKRGSHPSNPSLKTLSVFGVRPSTAGVDVSEHTAQACIAVASCVKIIAETSSMLPCKVFLDENGTKGPDSNHPLYRVLHDEANTEMSAMTFKETFTSHVASWGNGYAEKEYNGAGDIIGLWPLGPDRTEPERGPAGQLRYRTRLPDGEEKILAADQVLHVKGLSSTGLKGLSPIGQIRQAVGLALAMEEYGARFFANGAIPGVVLKHPGELSPAAKKNIRDSWNDRHEGLSRTQRLAILEEGVTLEKIGIPPEEAQFLQTRQFQDRQIAKFYRIPLHMLADMEKGSGFSSVEQMTLDFIKFTLMPWLVRLEQEYNRSLLLPSERRTRFVKHVVAGLERGDFKSRTDAYFIGRQGGWYSVDDIRELEDLNPLPKGQGKVYLQPLNMVPADQAGKAPPKAEDASRELRAADGPGSGAVESRGATARHRIARSHRNGFFEAASRIVRRERKEVSRAARRFLRATDVGGLKDWLEQFYADHAQLVQDRMERAAEGLADVVRLEAEEEAGQEVEEAKVDDFVEQYVQALATRWCESSKGQLLAILDEASGRSHLQTRDDGSEEDVLSELERRLEEWEETRPEKTARNETNRLTNAVALAVFALGGVKRTRWRTVGKNCPMCSGLDGKVVGIEQEFLPAGHVISNSALSSPFTVKRGVKHPPLHRGCDCMLEVE